jgi:hypothetical protein
MSDDKIEIRAASAAPAVEGRRIAGHFARFGTFNRIEGAEGPFLERIEPGAFKKTLAEQGSRIRMLFQHGRDPEIGDKPIGAPDVLREDAIGPYFEADLFDSVPPLIMDGLRAGQYGISYRFSIPNPDQNDVWDMSPRRSDYNPQGIPERTIKQSRVYEYGVVTFPADPGADYAVRSLTLADLDAPYASEPEQPALPEDAAAEEPHVEASREAVNVPPPTAAPPPRRFRSQEDWLAWLTKES